MQSSRMTSIFLATALISSACFFPAYANAMSENCELGNTCRLPGDDGGQTHFRVTPSTGMDYFCEVKSEGDSLKFSVSSGKDFKITQGSGIYNANPSATVEINGRFDKPNNPEDVGEIRFTKMPLSADGTVKCVAKKR